MKIIKKYLKQNECIKYEIGLFMRVRTREA